jgi:membrane protein implicated in regulation of membrane protease activity
VAFLLLQRITAWLARKQQERLREQQQEQMRQQQVQQQRVQEQPQEQELLLFYRKQPGQQQRSQLPEREFCS